MQHPLPPHLLNPSQASLVKAALHCLGPILAALDASNWPAAAAPFAAQLSFILDNRPKVLSK